MDRERERETGNGQFAHHLFYERVDGASLMLFERVNDTFLRYTFLSFFFTVGELKRESAHSSKEKKLILALFHPPTMHVLRTYIIRIYIYMLEACFSIVEILHHTADQ